MRKLDKIFIVIICCLAFLSVRAISDETNSREKALEALKAEDYQTAINICLSQLESDPNNYEFNFILSRAYAYSRQWKQALSSLEKMMEIYPGNQDLLLFRARVHAWKGDYEMADSGFGGVLAMEADNREAMIGRAEIASWKKEFADAREKYQEILVHDPNDPDIHFRIGRVYLWEGNYQQARQYYKKACELDPENVEYRRALQRAHPDFSDNYELRYQYQNQGYSDERGHYTDHHLVFSLKISPDIGSLHLKYNGTHRYGEQDSRFGIEFYPHLWKKAYGYIDIHFSPKAIHFPSTSYHLEVYQSFLRAAEISLGYRRMNFETEAVNTYLGSVGYYIGNYYPFVRMYFTPEDEGTDFSWFVNVRRYFTKDNYVAVGYGRGSRPFDITTIEDLLVQKSWIFLAEWNWYFLERIHLKIQFTHRNEEDGPVRNSLFLATGYRW
jgi:YaiO family outer membrane protein